MPLLAVQSPQRGISDARLMLQCKPSSPRSRLTDPPLTAIPEESTLLRHAAAKKNPGIHCGFLSTKQKGREGKETMSKSLAALMLTLFHADSEGRLSKQEQESPNKQHQILKWMPRPWSADQAGGGRTLAGRASRGDGRHWDLLVVKWLRSGRLTSSVSMCVRAGL